MMIFIRHVGAHRPGGTGEP